MGKNSKCVLIFIFSFLIFNFFIPQNALCKRYVSLEIRVEEGVAGDSQSFELVDKRVLELELDKQASTFQGNFSLYLTPSIPAYPLINLRIELFTIGPDFQSQFMERVVGKDEIITLEPVRVKQGRVFKISLVPDVIEKEEMKTHCKYNLADPEGWYSDVSVRFQYHYLKNSLADYHWNMNKGYLESEYRRLERYFNFQYTRKVDYHLCPCELPQITWDHRFGISIDPVKNSVFVLYNQKDKTVDSPAAWFTVFYQYWGYAPAFVVEGVSGSLGLGHYFTKKLKDKREILPLSRLKISKDYRSYPARIAFVEVSSFVHFLTEKYGAGKFKMFYQEVTDLTFDQVFEKIYSKSLSQVESEWLSFLDGYEILYDEMSFFANIKFNYNDFDTVIPIFEDLLIMAETEKESLNALQALGNSYYLSGRYEDALSAYQRKSSYNPEDPRTRNTLGNVYYLLGDFESSKENYHKAQDLDTNSAEPWVNLGRLYLISGEFDSARVYFELAEKKDVGLESLINLNLGNAKIYRISGDSIKAKEKSEEALDFSKLFLSQVPERAVPYLKIGESLLDLGFPDSALRYFELAEFLEERPFYQGELFLNLGKACHLTGEEDLAQVYFQRVLEIPSAVADQKEAKRFLEKVK